MIKKIIEYIKYSMEPNEKQLRAEALEAARAHFRGVPRYAISVNQWIRYQQSYKSVYRHTYAKNKMKTI